MTETRLLPWKARWMLAALPMAVLWCLVLAGEIADILMEGLEGWADR